MKVDFNNLRRRTLDDFDAVVELIRENVSFLDETGPDFRRRLTLRLDALRFDVVAIAASYSEEAGLDDVLGDRVLLTLSEQIDDEEEVSE